MGLCMIIAKMLYFSSVSSPFKMEFDKRVAGQLEHCSLERIANRLDFARCTLPTAILTLEIVTSL